MDGTGQEALVREVRARLEHEPRIHLHEHPLRIAVDHGDLLLEGELGTVAGKKLALEAAAAIPGIHGIVDRLHVEPSQRMGDAELLDHALRSLAEDPALRECAIVARRGERQQVVRPLPQGARGKIEVRVEDGVVTLDGDIPALTEKRIAESLVWWIPGTRDVVNGLGVTPEEEDSDAEIADALSIVLEKDPLLHGSRIRVQSASRVVTLSGTVPSGEQSIAAEEDAWCLFGVDKVVNALEVAAPITV